MRSSQAAVDLIVTEEISSRAVYEKRYQHPEWPGGASGITIGIGYDCGYATRERIQADWLGMVTPKEVALLQNVAGLKGAEAHAALASVQPYVTVSWNAAMHVFEKIDVPKWEATVVRACPGSDKLPADCFGAIMSIAYNRGASFSQPGDRYREMRNIRAHIANNTWDKIPDEIRSMKRLWGPSQSGLLRRRDHEAALFERGLAAHSPAEVTPRGNEDQGSEVVATKQDTPLNVQPTKAKYDLQVEVVQRKLVALNYHEVGDIDGFWGGKTRGAIVAFMNDRGDEPTDGHITPEVIAELNKATNEGWSRPIAPSRANATAKDIAVKVPSVDHNWYTKAFAYAAGIPSAITAGFKAVFGEQSSIVGYVQPIKDFFGAVPAEFYFAAIAGIAVLIVIQATRAENATVRAYQRGEIN